MPHCPVALYAHHAGLFGLCHETGIEFFGGQPESHVHHSAVLGHLDKEPIKVAVPVNATAQQVSLIISEDMWQAWGMPFESGHECHWVPFSVGRGEMHIFGVFVDLELVREGKARIGFCARFYGHSSVFGAGPCHGLF